MQMACHCTVRACILPHTDLKQSHIPIERTSHKTGTKYLLADADKVRAWLQKLFKDHNGIVQLKNDGKLKLSEEALHSSSWPTT
jgi:hypothetical protein